MKMFVDTVCFQSAVVSFLYHENVRGYVFKVPSSRFYVVKMFIAMFSNRCRRNLHRVKMCSLQTLKSSYPGELLVNSARCNVK